jgi:hypothetical protein
VNVVGYVFVALIALGLWGALVMVALSFPDIRRYVSLRRV